MSCLWTCLSLLFVAPFLQKSVSSATGVSMECNKTVEVVAGEAVTLNCTIMMPGGSEFDGCDWNNTRGKIPCDSVEYTCASDNQTYVSLTIWKAMRDENYTILIVTDHGLVKSHIKLQVQQNSNSTQGNVGHKTQHTEQTTNLYIILAVIMAISIALGILVFLFRTDRGRKKTGCFQTQGVPDQEALM